MKILSPRMKALTLVWVFMLFSTTISERDKVRPSLTIVTSLKNETLCVGSEVTLQCVIKDATSYMWLKNGRYLTKKERQRVEMNLNSLKITHFRRQDSGLYACVGKDSNGHSNQSAAWITNPDPSCCPQKDVESPCRVFIARNCPHIHSYATQTPELNVSYYLHKAENPLVLGIRTTIYHSALSISWEVPKQGRDNIWGWQVTVFGLENVPGYQRCYQINRNKKSIMETNVEKFGALTEWMIEANATYKVVVQGLPSMDERFERTVVSKIITVPSRCVLLKLPCCKSKINARLGSGKNNRTTLFWTTEYPPNLNITIDAFIISWMSEPNDRCNANFVVLGSHKSNYSFANLTNSCGNYTIKINATLRSPSVECPFSLRKYLFYIPPADFVNPDDTQKSSNEMEPITAAVVAVSCTVIGVLVVVLYVTCKKNRGKQNSPAKKQLINNNVDSLKKVFFLHTNHCECCKDVVQSLATLLEGTGYMTCVVDLFVPMNKMERGPVEWMDEKIENSDYIIIPWMFKIDDNTRIKGKSVRDMSNETKLFRYGLGCVNGLIMSNPDKKGKFIPVYPDHSTFEILPLIQKGLHTFKIPSQIDNLVMALIGEPSRQPDPSCSTLYFDYPDYKSARNILETAVDKVKKCHPESQNQNIHC